MRPSSTASSEALLAQSIVPAALLERGKPSQPIWTVQRFVTEYLRNNAVPDSEVWLLGTVRGIGAGAG